MRDVAVMILAGGKGESLGLLTKHRPASALPYGGKYRLVDFVISNCCHSELGRVGLLTQYAPTSLNRHVGIGRAWGLDRVEGGLTLLQAFGTRQRAAWYRGTADALSQNRDRLYGSRHTLVLSADAVYVMDYNDLLSAHVDSGAEVTLAVKPVPAEQTSRYGMVALRDGRVVSFEEKPQQTASRLASMGIYCFRTPELMKRLEAGTGPDIVYDVLLPMLEQGGEIGAFEFDGYHEDVGTVDAYYRANMDLLARRPPINLYDPEWPVHTRNEELAPALLGANAQLEGALLSNGCLVDGEVRESILFGGVSVEAGARVEGSILFPGVRVASGAHVRGAILDKRVRVGAGANIGGSGAITVVGKGATIPEGMQVGEGARIDVGCGPSDYPSASIPAHSEIVRS